MQSVDDVMYFRYLSLRSSFLALLLLPRCHLLGRHKNHVDVSLRSRRADIITSASPPQELRKSVSFKRQKHHRIYEYPGAPPSPDLGPGEAEDLATSVAQTQRKTWSFVAPVSCGDGGGLVLVRIGGFRVLQGGRVSGGIVGSVEQENI